MTDIYKAAERLLETLQALQLYGGSARLVEYHYWTGEIYKAIQEKEANTNPDDTGERTLRKVVFSAGHEYDASNNGVVADLEDANIVCSDSVDGVFHYPVIDIDFPIKAIPSSSPGHFHLYIDVPVEWAAYQNLLNALVEAGIVQEGYVAASIRRGHTDVRLPWVTKPPEPEPLLGDNDLPGMWELADFL